MLVKRSVLVAERVYRLIIQDGLLPWGCFQNHLWILLLLCLLQLGANVFKGAHMFARAAQIEVVVVVSHTMLRWDIARG